MAVIGIAKATPAPILLPRQGALSGYTSVTFNNGLYTPVTSTSIVAQTDDTDSSQLSNLPDTDSSSLKSTPATSTVSGTATSTSTEAASSSSSPFSSSSTSSTASSTSTNPPGLTARPSDTSKHKEHFPIKYFIPLFVLIGVILLLVLVGKTWGRIAYSREKATRRRSRQERLLLREQQKQRVEAIQKQWLENGWGDDHPALEKQHYNDGYDSDLSDDDESEKGPLSATGNRLAKSDYLQRTRVETPIPTGKADGASLRATLRGTWDRVKLRITGNVGWGYNGSTPEYSLRRQIVAEASSHNLWSRIPTQQSDLPHTSEGLLRPPMLDDDGVPIMPTSKQTRRTLYPLATNSPELRNPPNTIKAIPSSSSLKALASVKNLFHAIRSRSSQSFGGGSSYGGRHQTPQSSDGVDAELHSHPDGSRCLLGDAHYLSHGSAKQEEEAQSLCCDDESPQQIRDVATSVPAVTVQRKTTQIHVRKINSDDDIPSLTPEEPDDIDCYTAMPPTSSILRDKSKRSLAPSRSSTVRFTDTESSSGYDTTLVADASPVASSVYSYATESVAISTPQSSSGSETMVASESRHEKLLRKTRSMVDSPPYLESISGEVNDEVHERNGSKKEARRTNSKKSSRSYTEAVNFGDDDDENAEPNLLDSRFLHRSRTVKRSLVSLAIDRETAEEEDHPVGGEEVIMDLTNATYEADEVPGSQLSAFYNAYYDEDERDVGDDIDSVLSSLIASSHNSPELAVELPEAEGASVFNTPSAQPSVPPLPSTPMGKKKTWQERNGKWERLSEEEVLELNKQAGVCCPSPLRLVSPSPLPAPPLAIARKPATPVHRLELSSLSSSRSISGSARHYRAKLNGARVDEASHSLL